MREASRESPRERIETEGRKERWEEGERAGGKGRKEGKEGGRERDVEDGEKKPSRRWEPKTWERKKSFARLQDFKQFPSFIPRSFSARPPPEIIMTSRKLKAGSEWNGERAVNKERREKNLKHFRKLCNFITSSILSAAVCFFMMSNNCSHGQSLRHRIRRSASRSFRNRKQTSDRGACQMSKLAQLVAELVAVDSVTVYVTRLNCRLALVAERQSTF